jgi:monoamine oxidase
MIGAHYCVCTLPLSILKTLDIDCALEKKHAFQGMRMASVYKLGWESPRFWEKHYHIYGGISFPKQTVDLVWYPSNGLFGKTGIILSGFNLEHDDFSDGSPTAFGALPTMQAKFDASRAAVEVLHPGHGKSLTKPIYVSWKQIPYSLGCFAMNGMPSAKPAYDELNQPDGCLFFAGDYLSHIVAWQEGAALSAHRAISGIATHMQNSQA